MGLYEDVIYETIKLSIKYRDMLKGVVTREDFDKHYNDHRRMCYEDKNLMVMYIIMYQLENILIHMELL